MVVGLLNSHGKAVAGHVWLACRTTINAPTDTATDPHQSSTSGKPGLVPAVLLAWCNMESPARSSQRPRLACTLA